MCGDRSEENYGTNDVEPTASMEGVTNDYHEKIRTSHLDGTPELGDKWIGGVVACI